MALCPTTWVEPAADGGLKVFVVGNAGVAVDGHQQVQFCEHRTQLGHETVDTADRQGIEVGAAYAHCGCPQRQSLGYIGTTAHARVEEHRHAVGRFDDGR
jgi:hypothetical protein